MFELIYRDWYERLSQLEYNYHPKKDGEAWYRAEDVWACIEAPNPIELLLKGGDGNG